MEPRSLIGCALALAACTGSGAAAGQSARPVTGDVRPGISVLLDDSVHLVHGRRVGLVTNHTGLDERGRSDIDLLRDDPRARAAGVRLVMLFSPEHGLRGTEDRTNLASGRDARTGLPVHSLYTNTTVAPADTLLRQLDVLVFDLQDVGTRTWTYVGAMVYAIRAAARTGVPIVVLDRPNPITGARADGPLLDSALANPEEHRRGRPGRAYALWPFPLRHGMTMGEMARFYNEELSLGAQLHVVPAANWRRDEWFDETGLPWVKPSPNIPNLTSALLYAAVVPFEATNLSVGRGTPDAFHHLGAPWVDGERLAALLNDQELPGLRFEAERFTPRAPGDGKYGGRRIPGVRIVVEDRERVHAGRLSAALLWAVARLHRDSLRIRLPDYDLLFGSRVAREALLAGDDPDAVIDRSVAEVVAFQQRARKYYLYR
ncbi:MAG TPA: DUF1343 domain-containing protein [Gemmatimonadaceae bacterium]|nr:DUF1343 domain-containing protein [Gemmatimonadaceae bacterium]